MDTSEVHRLEPDENRTSGLILKKEKSEKPGFKMPKASLLGLDVLAKARKASGNLLSFKSDDNDDQKFHEPGMEEVSEIQKRSADEKIKNYRPAQTETPTYTGGVSKTARHRIDDREKEKAKGIYASTSKEKDRNFSRGSSSSDKKDRRRDDYRDYHDRKRTKRRSSERDERDYKTDRSSSRYREEPQTPRESGRHSIGRTAWDEEDEEEYARMKKKKSTWDFPTPDVPHRSRTGDESVRSYRSVKESQMRLVDSTPRPTPAHKYNLWAADRKKSGATPQTIRDGKVPWENAEDKDLWEEEQVRLDREWYNMDEGYDDENNPFAGASAEYLKKREEQLEIKKKKRISAQQRQINKDNELWEKNRLLTSGVVMSINVNEDFEEETVERVHLLVSHTVPPFLDGRIVFTKQPEPVIPVKDPTSDMALVARKGSALVRVFREQKERKKAQKKHWDLGGTKMGNIMGVEKKKDEDDAKFDADTDTADYRRDQKFADHMNNPENESKSDFSRKKTLYEQRCYLPAFACRQDLLNVIRENSVVIIVGETGSGKDRILINLVCKIPELFMF